MRMGEGVEWGVHYCILLAWLDDQAPVPTGRLAAVYELPPVYLKKQLQALVRAGILASVPGAAGGYRLARSPEKITLLDVVVAVEGRSDAFQCTEIRQRGAGSLSRPSAFEAPCAIAGAMRKAELAWRRELAAVTVADMMADTSDTAVQRTRRFYQQLIQG